jgi:hypothetical protein
VEASHQRERIEGAILNRLETGESTMSVYGFH